jgi:hypothetical protein
MEIKVIACFRSIKNGFFKINPKSEREGVEGLIFKAHKTYEKLKLLCVEAEKGGKKTCFN